MIDKAEDLKIDSSLTYLYGNAHIISNYLKTKYNTDKPRVCFFGDQYTSDVYHS